MHILPANLSPSQIQIMAQLGFERCEETPSHLTRWNGHGLTLTFASDQEVTMGLVMKRVIEQAGAVALQEAGQLIKHLLKL